ncbi:serine threonine-protein kinase csk1 [Diaporthe amygdali]|uniref:serine threonine-protein kinase csk1 n=1 Tax=Phomopsis amygdali TaxID=1214568 RepID=UPI0022FEB0B3|nr:serine threonine-protein kinase csk1 [Diaporthe amygdali]KAJ0118853.1 serine threonine-protein kinase csk1 [Diaporthe amygdali]
MTGSHDWQASLTASERYDNIQKIQIILSNQKLASEYDAACNSPLSSEPQQPEPLPSDSYCAISKSGNDDSDEEAGERIGPYRNCQYVASGVTAEVYRHKDRALKVITETHGIEPHNPTREAKILAQLKKPCIPLLETFRDHEDRFTLVFPYMPLTLSALLERGPLTNTQIRSIFNDVFHALADIHGDGIIHRDVKPQAILLESPDGPAYLSDFGTAWHPDLSSTTEPAAAKILDIGTGPYRAPEVLFGDKSYGPPVDMWAAGCMLAECVRSPPKPLFESRAVHEDGNQLGLILSIFKTIGTPTIETWPEAASFRTPPFEIYRVFEAQPWEAILSGVDEGWRDMIAALVRYDSKRMTAQQALECQYLKGDAAI